MALTEKYEHQVEVTETNHIQVRTKRIILDGNEQVSATFHRHVIAPGDDYSGEVEKVKRIAKLVHTAAVVAEYKRIRDLADTG